MDGSVSPAESTGSHGNLFIRPLPPGWDEARLGAFFGAFGEIDSVRISLPAPGSRAGVAHAFCRFKEAEAAQAALTALQGALLDGIPVAVKLADADMAPRIQSGLCASEWCYARGLPAHLSREDVAAIFTAYGPVKDLKHFPSTEYYRGSGALVQYEAIEHSTTAIQALNGCLLPGATQPLLVRYADSPAEKAAKAARKERLAQRNGVGAAVGPLALQEQLQKQIMELSLKASASQGLLPGAAMPAATSFASGPVPDGAWAAPAPPARPHGGAGCSIYIKGMPEDADKLWLYEKFSRFGGILSVRVLLDEHTGRCNGIGFVNFTDPEGARAAHETMNGVSMGERLLHVMVQSHGGARGGGGAAAAAGGAPRGHPSAGSLAAAAGAMGGMGTNGAILPQSAQFMQPGDFLHGGGGW